MNTMMKGAFALTAGLCAASESLAQDPGHSMGPPPQVLATLGALGASGVMEFMLSDEMQGLQQARIGASRNNLRFVDGLLPNEARPDRYEDNDRAFVLPLTVLKALPSSSGVNFLRFSYSYSRGDGDRDVALENDGDISRAIVQFLRAPDPTTIFGIGLTYEKGDIDNLLTEDPFGTAGRTVRSAWGLQLSFGKDFAGPWAMVSKAEFQNGTTDFTMDKYLTPDMFIDVDIRDQGDDRLYLETTFIGTYSDLSGIPQGWVLHPTFGATFQRNFIEEVDNSFGQPTSGAVGKTEDYGLIMAKATLEKAMQPHPGLQVLPRIGVGVEHEYVNDLDRELEDRTYGVLSLGVGVTKFGQRLGIDYSRRHGLDGNRSQHTLTAMLTMTF